MNNVTVEIFPDFHAWYGTFYLYGLCATIRTLANDVLVMVAQAREARETSTQADFSAMFCDVRDSIFQICTLADLIEEKSTR